MLKTIKSRLKRLSMVLIIISLLGVNFAAPVVSNAATVGITQNGSTVTATNGSYTLTFNLSTGKGTLTYGSVILMNEFYGDYNVSGAASRISTYDSATRTASWTSIGNDGYGNNGYKLTIKCEMVSGSTIYLNFYIYNDISYFLTDMQIDNSTSQAIDFIEPVACLNLDIGNFSDERIMTTPYTNNDDFGVCPVNNFGSFTGTSHWVCSVFDNANRAGFVAGAATTAKWKSMQYLRQAGSANAPLSGFSVYNSGGTQSGTTVSSDKFFLGYYSDYRTGLEEFGQKYTVAEPAPVWTGDVPKGYNSWYSLKSEYATLNTMYNVVDYVNNNLKSLGYNYVNLDSANVNEIEQIPFVNYVHSKGLKAGAYTCPLMIWDAYKDDPIPGTSYYGRDAILKDSSGNYVTSYFGDVVYALDATSPAGQAAITYCIQSIIDKGFDYIKMDFLDYGMLEGSFFDSNANGMQNYRAGMAIVKQLVDNSGREIFLSESIAPLLPSGYANARRSGCDTELGLRDYNGVERQSFNAIASWFTNGTIYKYNDVDMAMVDNYVGSDYWMNTYSKNNARLLCNSIAAGGGLWLTSENLPLVPEDKMSEILANASLMGIINKGKAARPIKMTNFNHLNEKVPSLSYFKDGNDRYVVVSNWDKSNPVAIDINWSDIELPSSSSYYVVDMNKKLKLGSYTNKFTMSFTGAYDSRILKITSTTPPEPAPATNLAVGKTLNASSIYSAGWEANKAGDGDWTTRWSAGSTSGQWLELDFGSNTTVNRVVIEEYKESENYAKYYTISEFTLQYWNGSAYVNIAKDSKIGYEKEINFPSVTTSKLRLVFTNQSFLPSIKEFEAYNIASNTGNTIALDDSDANFSTYSDIRQTIQRMQVFQAPSTSIPRIDLYSYSIGSPKDLSVAIYSLDAKDNPLVKLFEANINSVNFPTTLNRIPINCKLTGLTAGAKYGMVLKSANSPDTDNCYGFGYSDSNPLANSFERLSTNGGSTWSTESSGNRDLKITIYR